MSTLENLSVYLTLDKARKRYDFREEDYGLSSDEAFNIARIFSKCAPAATPPTRSPQSR